MVTRLSIQGSAINAIGDEDVRVSKRLYIPSRKLRGFESGKIGPKDSGDYIGGNYTAVLNASTSLPEFGAILEKIDFLIIFKCFIQHPKSFIRSFIISWYRFFIS